MADNNVMAAEILADWDTGLVIIREKSKEGLALVKPIQFAFPMAIFIKTACNLQVQKIDREMAAIADQMRQGILPGGKIYRGD
jgi:hypothetical protein